jgi:dephospho-CoA kinase
MKTVVIINGFPGAGKDTFVELIQRMYPNTGNVHTSDPAKTAAKTLGWEGEKDALSRAFLADLVFASYNLFDGPTKYVLQFLERTGAPVTFVHSREPERIKLLVERLKAEEYKVITLYINRNVGNEFSNKADADVWRYAYDVYIDNNGTLDTFERNAMVFMDRLLTGGHK